MSGFTAWPDGLFFLCGGALSAAVILQALNLSYGFRPLEREQALAVNNLFEISVLAQLMTMVLLLSETAFHLRSGFAALTGYAPLRYGVCLVMAALAATVCRRKNSFAPLAAPLAAALILPAAEQFSVFSGIFLLDTLFWLLRSLRLLLLQLSRGSRQLTALSIKDALDRLDSGLLFCRKNGRIILRNERMRELMAELVETPPDNGRSFYSMLADGSLRKGCTREKLDGALSCRLTDGTVWQFTRHDLRDGRRTVVLLLASDTTELWEVNRRLLTQDRELARRNRELQTVLANLEETCRSEVTLQAKSRVHDVLGQRISLLLRAMREHRKPDEALLRSFAEGLPQELREVTADGGYSLDTLAKVFRRLGVTVHVDGWLPEQEESARVFYEIAVEAVTNAVRHGYASEVFITFSKRDGLCCMDVENRGLPTRGPVVEGGGLRGMRKKALRLGGSFSYESTDSFRVHVELPGEETV